MNINDLLKQEIASIELNEWTGMLGEKQVTLFAKPLSPADIKHVERYDKTFTSQPSLEGFIRAMILKTVDSDGNKVFGAESLPLLRNMEVGKIGDMAGALFKGQFDDEDYNLETVEKN